VENALITPGIDHIALTVPDLEHGRDHLSHFRLGEAGIDPARAEHLGHRRRDRATTPDVEASDIGTGTNVAAVTNRADLRMPEQHVRVPVAEHGRRRRRISDRSADAIRNFLVSRTVNTTMRRPLSPVTRAAP
jgi:hypothetical protein